MNMKIIFSFVAVLAMAAIWGAGAMDSQVCAGQRYVMEEKPRPSHYPKRFSGTGHIDRISGSEVVIDDSLYSLSPDVTYGTPGTRNGSWRRFKPGTYVGFVLNGKKTIASLWLFK